MQVLEGAQMIQGG